MPVPSLQDVLEPHDNPIQFLRNQDMPPGDFIWTQPDEYTNWIEEQRAIREAVSLRDMSFHMDNRYFEGPDAVELFSDFGVNGFEDLRIGDSPQAKQIVCCNPDGYVIGDGALYHIDDEEFVITGAGMVSNWLEYNAETGDYDVTVETGNNPMSEDLPREFRFQVQGPNAKAVLEAVTERSLPDIGLFEMAELTIEGTEMYALGHGMGGSYGLEISGPFEHHEAVKNAIMDAGEEHGIRQLGSKSYKTLAIEIGWIASFTPAIYGHEDLADYRERLEVASVEANTIVGGSYYADDITDYYLNPVELGYEHLIDFDHDFVGKEAVKETVDNPRRERVTFVWNAEDVVDMYASLFEDGETNKFFEMPDPGFRWNVAQYDRIEKDGEIVGLSKDQGYLSSERAVLSIGVIDTDYAEPGTEVTLVWGDEKSENSAIERHTETEIQATVSPSPYLKTRE
ncbi:hypothetical protein [Halobellus rufus]|uniref:hypothetical protein n=1 Tax=Halobellus rufus TaxID=1448860 RepID=UPI00067883FC|nr:hypothetical protein [Halobellus rufus]